MSNNDINSLKNQKAAIAAEIKALEETPKAKMSSIWMTMVYAFSIVSMAIFVFKPAYYIIALAVFALTIILGVTNLLIVKNKNQKIEKKILSLKVEENKIISLITAERNKITANAQKGE